MFMLCCIPEWYSLFFSLHQNQTFLHIKGQIQLGRFQIRSRDVRLTDSFLDDLKFLPAAYDKGEYFKFLEDYGTHYAVSGTVGGRYELVYVLDNYAMSRLGMLSADLAVTKFPDSQKRCVMVDLCMLKNTENRTVQCMLLVAQLTL